MFTIKLKATCSPEQKEQTIFIVKEMKKPQEEVANLAKIATSEQLKKYLLESNQKPEGIQIALGHQNIAYFYKGIAHYMAILQPAPGQSIGDHLKDFLTTTTKDPKELEKKTQKIKMGAYQVGTALGKLHRDHMQPKGAIFGKTITHGDLHMDNLFVDIPDEGGKPIRVTLIDAETMANSLNTPQPVSHDLIRLYAHATSRFLGKSSLVQRIGVETWNQLFFEPFITGYAKQFPAEKLGEVKRELKKIFTGASVFNLISTQKVLYNPATINKMREQLAPIIDAIK